MDEDILFFNGIDESGEYLKQPRPLRFHPRPRRVRRDARDDVNLKVLSQAGWGVIFAQGDPLMPAICEAMQPLLALRQEQASDRYRKYTGELGYQPKEDKQAFLQRRKLGPGPVTPENVPYYLLIVGSPEAIPYTFQYQLDVPCAVGRIHFDKLEEYENYARGVVEAEKRSQEGPRRIVLFGARHPNDPPTEISLKYLLEPLRDDLRRLPGLEVSTVFNEEATQSRLGELLDGEKTPSILFTAGHGVGFKCDNPRQKDCQGALLCHGWPGRGHPAKPDHYFSAQDLDDASDLTGLISFHFACYSAGTPLNDDFSHDGGRARISPEPFVARLPQRMLSLSRGGALAVIGHVDQACQSSFVWKAAGSQVATFADALLRLQDEFPVGAAMEPLNRRYAEISADLCAAEEDMENGVIAGEEAETKISFLRIARRDARNYVIVGDPAVRLPGKPVKKRIMRGG